MKHQNGLLASLAIQCVHPDTGETGCWLFGGESHRNPGSAKTPVFKDLADLFQWLAPNGWNAIGHGLQQRYIYHDFMEHGRMVENEMLSKHPNCI